MEPSAVLSPNGTVEEMCPSSNADVDLREVITVLGFITSLVGIAFNGVSIAALASSGKLLKKPFTVLLINLAVADLLFCASDFSNAVIRYICLRDPSCFGGGTGACFLYNLIMLLKGMDWWTVMLIALERYISVCKTIYYKKLFTLKKIFAMVAGFWFLGIGLTLVPHIGQLRDFSNFKCDTDSDDISYRRTPMASFFIAFAAVPFLVMLFCYSAIYFKLRKYSKWRAKSMKEIPSWMKKNSKDLTKTSFYVCCFYFLCVIVNCNVFLVTSFFDICRKFDDLRLISRLIFTQMFWINNFMYMFRIKAYREAYLKLFGRFKFWEPFTIKTITLGDKNESKPTNVTPINLS